MKIYFFLALLSFSFYAQSQNADKVDKRALIRYSKEEIDVMPLVKIEQLNFLYNSSFTIPQEMEVFIKQSDIDVTLYSLHRKENERVQIDLGLNDESKTGKYIILLSYKEVDQAFEDIRAKNTLTK